MTDVTDKYTPPIIMGGMLLGLAFGRMNQGGGTPPPPPPPPQAGTLTVNGSITSITVPPTSTLNIVVIGVTPYASIHINDVTTNSILLSVTADSQGAANANLTLPNSESSFAMIAVDTKTNLSTNIVQINIQAPAQNTCVINAYNTQNSSWIALATVHYGAQTQYTDTNGNATFQVEGTQSLQIVAQGFNTYNQSSFTPQQGGVYKFGLTPYTPPPPPNPPTVTISPPSGGQGTIFVVKGSNFSPNSTQPYVVIAPNGLILFSASATVQSDGTFLFVIPYIYGQIGNYEVGFTNGIGAFFQEY